ncbi:MAG: 30S ribosomal protein S6, partial [Chloroflexota bacterium]
LRLARAARTNHSLSARRPPSSMRAAGNPRERRHLHMATKNEYEVIFIIHPATPEDELTNLIEKIKQYVTAGGGDVTAVNSSAPWGKRKLAYPIRKVAEGFYSLMNMSIAASSLPELERNLKLLEPVMRYSVVRL